MDCEKFDAHLMDALFGELDEVTSAAMKRHSDSCARCSTLESGMQATIDVGVLPLEEPSDDLEERILAAANDAHRHEPWHRRFLRTLSWAGSHAMRPQLAMAALLVLVLGSSLLLLRARPGSVAVTPVKVHEHGAPNLAEGSAAPPAAVAAASGASLSDRAPPRRAEVEPSSTAASSAAGEKSSDEPADKLTQSEIDETYERAMASYRAGRHHEAQRDFGLVNRSGGPKAASAALYEARAVRSHSGCQAAVAYYTQVQQRYGGSAVAADAAWEQADCYVAMGERDKARALWLALRSNSAYQAQASRELASEGQAASAGKPLASQQRAAAPPATATQPGGGTTVKAKPVKAPAPDVAY